MGGVRTWDGERHWRSEGGRVDVGEVREGEWTWEK